MTNVRGRSRSAYKKSVQESMTRHDFSQMPVDEIELGINLRNRDEIKWVLEDPALYPDVSEFMTLNRSEFAATSLEEFPPILAIIYKRKSSIKWVVREITYDHFNSRR